MDNQGREAQLACFEDRRRTIYSPYVDTVCGLEKACPEVIARSGSFHEKRTEGKARFRQVVQRRTSPPLCFMNLSARFALLACACLAERSEATCSRQAHARISNRVLGNIFDHIF